MTTGLQDEWLNHYTMLASALKYGTEKELLTIGGGKILRQAPLLVCSR